MWEAIAKFVIYLVDKRKDKNLLSTILEVYCSDKSDKNISFIYFQSAYKEIYKKVISKDVLNKLIESKLGAYCALETFGNATSLYRCDFEKGSIYKKKRKNPRFPYRAKKSDIIGTKNIDAVFNFLIAFVGVASASSSLIFSLFLVYGLLCHLLPNLILIKGFVEHDIYFFIGGVVFLPFISFILIKLAINLGKQIEANKIMPELMEEINSKQ